GRIRIPVAAPAEIEGEQLVENVGVGAPLDQGRLERPAQHLGLVEPDQVGGGHDIEHLRRRYAQPILAAELAKLEQPLHHHLPSSAAWPALSTASLSLTDTSRTIPLRSITTIVGSANTW